MPTTRDTKMTASMPAMTSPSATRRKLVFFTLLGVTLLAGLGVLGYATISQLHTALEWRERSFEVRGQVRLVRLSLTEMETGQRGYLLTGEAAYLAPYQRALARLDADFLRLVELTADDAAQQQALGRLKDLVAAKRLELQNTIDVRRSQGLASAQTIAGTTTGKKLMDEMQVLLAGMDEEEERRLGLRRDEEASSLRHTVLLAVLFGVLLATLLGAIYYLLRREMAVHAAYEHTLTAANAALEARVAERTRSVEESEARLNGIVNGAPDAIISIGEDEKIVVANPAAAELFGYPVSSLRGMPIERLIPKNYRSGHHAHVRRFGESAVFTRRMSAMRVVHALRADGSEFPVDASISQVRIENKKLYTVILRDITDEVRAKAKIEQSRRELRELTAAIEYVQEEERKRIAQELHDDLGQQLTVLKMDASLLRSKLAPGQQDVLRIAERLQSVLTRTVQSVRRISADLRPAMLDDLGLVPALEELVQQISQHSGLECRLAASDNLRVADKLATPLFRVAQESLNNAVKHAQAKRIVVSLVQHESELLLEIEDDGKGMSADGQHKRKSYGLIGMRERVYALGGEFAVESAPGQGTAVKVKIPLSDEAAAGADPVKD